MKNTTMLRLVAFCVGIGLLQPIVAQEINDQNRKDQVEGAANDWIRTGHSAYDWMWLASRYDRDRDGRVSPAEIPLPAETFGRIDRDWDKVLTETDFQWSKDSVLGKQKETTFALFKLADANSDGRLSQEEWQQVFTDSARDKQYLDEEQLEQLIYQPRVLKSAKEETLRTGRSEYSPQRLASLPVPQPGDIAPDFELSSPDSALTVRLSQFRGRKPVVLVFGCYTCGNYRTYSESLEKLYRYWKSDAEFLRVYVREAHPVATAQPATTTNKRAGIVIEQPDTMQERCDVAATFATALHITTPMVVDGIDNRVGQAYGAWPDRLYIIDREGKVAFTGGPGPFGFNPREMEQCLAMLLLDQPTNKP